MTTVHDVDERVCNIGGESRNRGLFGAFGVIRTLLLGAIVIFGLVALVVTQSPWVLLGLVIVAGVVWWALRRQTAVGESWTGALGEELRWRVARRQGTDVFEPDAGYATRPVPLELGSVRFMGVAATEDGPELSVVGHGLDCLTTVLEVVGGGEGMREIAQTNAASARFGRLLSRLARPDLPVEQVDFSTRVMPVESADYEQWITDRLRPGLSPELRDSMTALAAQAAWSGESYRSWITVRMSYAGLSAKTARRGVPVTPENVAETAFEVTGEVSRAAARAGLTVRAGLGPRRLGALLRHLYVPSLSMDNLAELGGARDGFVAYNAEGPAHRAGFEAYGPDGSTWWHATATIPRDGLPLSDVGVRWMECLVTDVTPPIIRTVTTQFRLVAKPEARARAAAALTLDKAAIIKDAKAGVVSTGEKEAQASVPQTILSDLLHEDAAGVETAVRATVSAPTHDDLLTTREVLESAAQDGGITHVKWHDTRHHHAHVLTLPFARGIGK